MLLQRRGWTDAVVRPAELIPGSGLDDRRTTWEVLYSVFHSLFLRGSGDVQELPISAFFHAVLLNERIEHGSSMDSLPHNDKNELITTSTLSSSDWISLMNTWLEEK